ILHGCEIGDDTLIGMGSTILNRVKIGKNCIIGANTLISEGKEIPDNSLVMGAPGKVVKEISPQQVQLIRMSALHYVENWQKHVAKVIKIG
ncbi:MAG: DapH/DapD/GlmU-related protein, partial [Hyphomonas sp.]|nr:DapH/DapD/GlmU-related protein [Hyphomonas sp.]